MAQRQLGRQTVGRALRNLGSLRGMDARHNPDDEILYGPDVPAEERIGMDYLVDAVRTWLDENDIELSRQEIADMLVDVEAEVDFDAGRDAMREEFQEAFGNWFDEQELEMTDEDIDALLMHLAQAIIGAPDHVRKALQS